MLVSLDTQTTVVVWQSSKLKGGSVLGHLTLQILHNISQYQLSLKNSRQEDSLLFCTVSETDEGLSKGLS